MKTNKVLALVLVVLLTFSLVSCGEKQADVIDYGDAESFEAALNAGENLEGKIVQFVAKELHPDSAFGYNVWAGEHLNFISSRNPDIKEGNTAVVRATTIESTLGSWIISYEKVENAIIGANTVFSGSVAPGGSTTTPSQAPDEPGQNDNGPTIEIPTEQPSTSELPLEVTDSGWYMHDPSGETAYVEVCGMIYNPNSQLIAEFPVLTVTAKDGDGIILATEDMTGSLIMPGDTITLCGMFSIPIFDSTDDIQMTFEADYSELSSSTMYQPVRSTDFEIKNVNERSGDKVYITGEIVNNFTEDVDQINLALVLRKDGKIVYMENSFVDNLRVGKSKAFEFRGEYPPHDSYELSAMVW